MKEAFAALALTLCFSCTSPEPKNRQQEKTKTDKISKIEAKKDSVKRDTIEFVSYNDNFDYTQLNGKSRFC